MNNTIKDYKKRINDTIVQMKKIQLTDSKLLKNELTRCQNNLGKKASKFSSMSTHHDSSSDNAPKHANVSSFEYRNQLFLASEYVRSQLGSASIAIVLGSGLGGFEDQLQNRKELPYEQIPYLPLPTVKGHSGKIIIGDVVSKDGKKSRRILCFSGRSHAYEVLNQFAFVFFLFSVFCLFYPIAIFFKKGLSDASSAFCKRWDFGVRHPRGDRLLDPTLISLMGKVAEEVKFPYYFGNYFWSPGPVYESAAQVRFAMACGAAAVGTTNMNTYTNHTKKH
ncbi:purine phosphorylase family protein [Reticulomyxa filosa]|uniref:Purine phosphorylase family protein n=1 Tax=Reticulomyxa filosa TaxID=46433 RepID=X6NEE7_RETFI|nr:purine phosphorylase family protein [Reticulomyxa filosa]|eukprot:ETO24700.1 purine phosphorylase family protein [Reticulomyxa filosa]